MGMDNGVHRVTDGSRYEDGVSLVHFMEHISVIILTCLYGIPTAHMLPCLHYYSLTYRWILLSHY